jgi:hypothetical protein
LSIIERAKRHAESLGRKVTEVPEWADDDGNPTVLYSKPITLFEMRKWWAGMQKDDITVFVDLIIAKAEDVDGEKVFTIEDKQPLLRTAEFSVLARVAGEMVDHDEADVIEKN